MAMALGRKKGNTGGAARISMARKRDELSILVVDDMKFNCEFIRRALQSEGYSDVRVAESASLALEQLQERCADVLLADWVMPEMDGLELTDRVRLIDEEMNRYTCILLLTARDDIDSVIEAFERGVDDYITKPPNKQELAARIYAAGRISSLHNNLLDTMASMQMQYEQHTTIDPLTGLGNYKDALRRFDELLHLVNSRGGGVCCAVVRISRAEELRSKYGQSGYEELLIKLGKRLTRTVRPADLVLRLNDTDFAIGMYFADVEYIKVKNFKRVLQGVNLRPLKCSAGFVTVTVGMGMCCNRSGDRLMDAEPFLQCAMEKVAISLKTNCTEVGA